MPLDAYSLCPGGTGKKIKFCCGDFLGDLQKITRMLDGEQFSAALQQIDRLLAEDANRDRACLLALKCQALSVTGPYEAVASAAADFLARRPDNQIALAESAIVETQRDVRAALDLLLRALKAAKGQLASRTYQAIGFVAAHLFERGLVVPARVLVDLQCDIAEQDQRAESMAAAMSRAADVPLLLREDIPTGNCPADAPWKHRFTEAMAPADLIDWQTAADRLAALAAEVPDAPVIWKNQAILRGWLGQNDAAAEAWRKYAALRAAEPDGLEDAVEAEATAMLLAADPLGDSIDMLRLTWTVKDPERAHEAFLSSTRFRPIMVDPARFAGLDTPPPKGAYMLIDRPWLDSAEQLTLETMPSTLGHVLLFGRQTDRDARLEMIGVGADELPAILAAIREAAGDTIESEPTQEVFGHQSATVRLLRQAWLPPRDATPEQLRKLTIEDSRNTMLHRWPDLKLGALGGRTPREAAAGQPGSLSYDQVKVLAAIMVFDHWTHRLPFRPDFNELRAALGLPTLGPVELAGRQVVDLPLTRLERLAAETLADQDLLTAFFRAETFSILPAARKFAQAIVDRPSLADAEERQHALALLARTEETLERALERIAEARQQADAKGRSNAAWDLMELSFHFAHHDGQNAMRLLDHIEKRHGEEPGVRDALTRIMIDVGLLNPDGTPTISPEEEQEMAAAEQAAADKGGLWTPDSAQPATGGKLWTPE
ncbi:MAG: hypothetical protein ABFC96_09745 [Thermoguttaceae bacterium]